MRIENMTSENLEDMSDAELRYMRSRCLNIFDRYFARSDVQKAVGMDRRLFLTKYLLLRSEMENRSIKLFRERPLDKEVHNRIFKASLWNLDVPALGDMVAIPNYVSICGDFVKSPVSVEKVDVVIRSDKEHRNEVFETKISELIKEQTNKEPNFIYESKGPDGAYIPLFDLILKSHTETRKVKEIKKEKVVIKKPEETDDTIRIPVGPDCEVTATLTIDKGQGIQALYCGKIKKVRTFLFDKRVKAWTMVSAKAWIKEQKEKVGKQIAKTLEKKLSEAQQKEYDEESILIRENAKNAKYPHKFEAAKWTHPNGHPRCIHCGDEQRVDDKDKELPCEKSVVKFKIIKIDKAKRLAGGIVYEPDAEDTQGDLASKEEIEKMMHGFMKRYATDTKRIKINHKGKRYFFPIIEAFIPEKDIVKGGETIPAGAFWLMIHISNDKIWDMVESRELEGFSMGGHSKARA